MAPPSPMAPPIDNLPPAALSSFMGVLPQARPERKSSASGRRFFIGR
jgi:hypothetical protein